MIRLNSKLGTSFLAAALPVLLYSSASAQLIEPGRTALEAARGGAVRYRAPGNMVSAGVAATLAAADAARAGVRISETWRPTPVRSQALADCLNIVFTQLNTMLALLDEVLLARAGASSSLSADNFNGNEIRR
ncbi:MAG: hypothetical protein JSU63_04680 [Phycisphaerales bacterium]|nr:MAG: hypothetical protein JSU63_04680 [Phycisphaerales bacterium]